MNLATLIFLALLFVVAVAVLVEAIVRSEIAEEAERQMTTWKPPGSPGKPDERSDDRAGD